jgi:putative tricarboxylic transport membrane protein
MAGKPKILLNKNIQDCIFVFIIGASLLWYAFFEHYAGPAVEWKMSPYLFPVLVATLLLLISVSLFFDGLHQIKTQSEEKAGASVKWKTVLVVVAMVVVYYLIMKPLHFIPSTIIFLAALIFYLGERRFWLIALISVVSTLAIYGIFGIALSVMLP